MVRGCTGSADLARNIMVTSAFNSEHLDIMTLSMDAVGSQAGDGRLGRDRTGDDSSTGDDSWWAGDLRSWGF